MHRANPTGFSNTLDESASCRNQALCKNRNATLHKICHAFSPTPLGSTLELLVKIECKWSAYTAIKANQPVLYILKCFNSRSIRTLLNVISLYENCKWALHQIPRSVVLLSRYFVFCHYCSHIYEAISSLFWIWSIFNPKL